MARTSLDDFVSSLSSRGRPQKYLPSSGPKKQDVLPLISFETRSDVSSCASHPGKQCRYRPPDPRSSTLWGVVGVCLLCNQRVNGGHACTVNLEVYFNENRKLGAKTLPPKEV